MLERTLRFLERQERISQNAIRKNMNEIERLKSSIVSRSHLVEDLGVYDTRRQAKKMTYGADVGSKAGKDSSKAKSPTRIRSHSHPEQKKTQEAKRQSRTQSLLELTSRTQEDNSK